MALPPVADALPPVAVDDELPPFATTFVLFSAEDAEFELLFAVEDELDAALEFEVDELLEVEGEVDVVGVVGTTSHSYT